MKKLLLIASLFIVTASHAQTKITKDANGNYSITKVPKADTLQSAGKFSGKTITDTAGEKHPIFISKNGKLFWYRKSKNNTYYKSYIKN